MQEYQKLLDDKINDFKTKKMLKCKEDAIEEAKVIVDSIFREHLANLRIDSIYLPEKANRPEKPIIVKPQVRKKLGPIIKQEEFDSLKKAKDSPPDSIHINY